MSEDMADNYGIRGTTSGVPSAFWTQDARSTSTKSQSTFAVCDWSCCMQSDNEICLTPADAGALSASTQSNSLLLV